MVSWLDLLQFLNKLDTSRPGEAEHKLVVVCQKIIEGQLSILLKT
jgi:hypothetical protein